MALPLSHGRLRASETIKFPLDVVFIPDGNPRPVTLLLRYAGRSNTALTNAAAKTPAASTTGTPADQATAADLRLAELYAKHVIVGWEDVCQEDGETPIAYTPAGGFELLEWLIAKEQRPDVFRTLVFVASDAERFLQPRVDPGAVGKR